MRKIYDYSSSISVIYQAMVHTPWWVWILFGILLFRGITALKATTIPLINIFIIPAIFLVLSLYSVLGSDQLFTLLPIWLLFFVLGIAIGWFLFQKIKIHIDKQHNLITIPGSPLLLIMLFSIFIIKYGFGYIAAIRPLLAQTLPFIASKTGLSAIIVGIFAARVICFLDKYIRIKR
jgi:hypothetical protein